MKLNTAPGGEILESVRGNLRKDDIIPKCSVSIDSTCVKKSVSQSLNEHKGLELKTRNSLQYPHSLRDRK